MKPVTLKSRWFEILGNKQDDMPDDIRRERWEQWKSLAIKKGGSSKEMAEYWTDTSACHGCIHKEGDWCRLQQLPCTVNSVLTFKENIIGMACMGDGYETEGQKQLDFESIF